MVRTNTVLGTNTTNVCWRTVRNGLMCEKCKAIDINIARCTQLKELVTEQLFVDGLVDLLKGYLAEKLALHPQAP